MKRVFKLDAAYLRSIGLDATGPGANKLLQDTYSTLELCVGHVLAQRMSRSELDDFDGYVRRRDEDGALRWLEAHFPDYRAVVSEQFALVESTLRTRIERRRNELTGENSL